MPVSTALFEECPIQLDHLPQIEGKEKGFVSVMVCFNFRCGMRNNEQNLCQCDLYQGMQEATKENNKLSYYEISMILD